MKVNLSKKKIIIVSVAVFVLLSAYLFICYSPVLFLKYYAYEEARYIESLDQIVYDESLPESDLDLIGDFYVRSIVTYLIGDGFRNLAIMKDRCPKLMDVNLDAERAVYLNLKSSYEGIKAHLVENKDEINQHISEIAEIQQSLSWLYRDRLNMILLDFNKWPEEDKNDMCEEFYGVLTQKPFKVELLNYLVNDFDERLKELSDEKLS